MLDHLKFEIEEKLEKEADDVRLLNEQILRSQKLTQTMTSLLNSFESRLSKLEETILPVYNETVTLQYRQQNLDKTLSALDAVICHYTVSQEVDAVIRAGLRHDSDGYVILEPYLQVMEKLEAARDFFMINNIKSVELDNVTVLFSHGCDNLSREFTAILQKFSQPVRADALLEMLALEEEGTEELPPSLQHFPEKINEILIKISEFLIMHDRDEYMNAYAAIRASTLNKSMGYLRDHQKSASGGSVTNISSSPSVKGKVAQKVSKRLQYSLEKRANKMFLKASQTLEQSTGFSLGSRRPNLLEVREDIVDKHEMDNFLDIVLTLQKLIQSERKLMIGIIPLQHHHKIFEIIIKDSMDAIVHEGEGINNRAKKCIARHDFISALVVFSISKSLLTIKPDFDRAIKGWDVTVSSKFEEILDMLHSTGFKILEEFIESVRSDTSSLPKDGTVHELTSNVLFFLEQLTLNEYLDTVGSVLNPKSNSQQFSHNLGHYIRRVLAQLNTTLVSKSDGYSDLSLKAIFLLNNYHHILKSLQRSALLNLVQLAEPDCERTFHNYIEQNRKLYMQCWIKVLQNIGGNDEGISLKAKEKGRDKDRMGIKEKFSGFNKDLEEVTKLHKGYSVPDLELRESLRRDTKEIVLPPYKAFYDRCGSVPFTKNPEKYIKYNNDQVSSLIDHIFDDSV